MVATLTKPRTKAKSQIPNPKSKIANPLSTLIPLAAIKPDPRNPRQGAAAELAPLADSLGKLDLLNPVQVRPAGKPGHYLLIAGERRYRAARLAGWKEIPAVVRDVDDATAIEIMVAENLHQKKLNTIERARSLELLTRPASEGGGGLTQVAAGKMIGMSDHGVCNLIRLLKLPPEWQHRVASGEIKERCGRALVPYVDRPEVLAAVAEDLAANPADWEAAAAFDKNLAFVVARLDALAAGEPLPDDFPDTGPTLQQGVFAAGDASVSRESAPAPVPSTAPTTVGRRSAPVDHSAPGGGAAGLAGYGAAVAIVLQIETLVDQLETLAQLDDVQAFLTARRRALELSRGKGK